VAVNSRSDLATFDVAARSLQLPTDNLLLCGLPLLSGEHREAPVDAPIKTVMFTDQPTVPQMRGDRLYVYQRLMAYAQAHPVQLQLRQARARRKAVREQGAVHAQRAGSELDPARRA
jgi:hypothetical protein